MKRKRERKIGQGQFFFNKEGEIFCEKKKKIGRGQSATRGSIWMEEEGEPDSLFIPKTKHKQLKYSTTNIVQYGTNIVKTNIALLFVQTYKRRPVRAKTKHKQLKCRTTNIISNCKNHKNWRLY